MPFTIKQNDRRPFFVVALKDDFGEASEAAVDLTTATTVTFSMREGDGGAVKVNKQPATKTDAAGGEVTYQWGAADLDTVGPFEAEVEVTWADGKVETFPNDGYFEVEVVDDIA